MFWALKGATRTPLRASQRQIPAVTTLLPASDVVPATSIAPVTCAAFMRSPYMSPKLRNFPERGHLRIV
ncbi:hypothetical protein GCM10010176_048780 [Nonomuraea spiralis]|nr:hypothetical protein GCM10010176_048780 [Nonomuraea spiralis]